MQCTSIECDEKATFHITYIEARKCVQEKHLCENHARITLTSDPIFPIRHSQPACKLDGAKHFEIDMLVISELHDQQVIYLREVNGDKRIPILTGIFEATTLDRYVKGYQSPWPLTHDVMATLIRAFDAEVQDVLIDDLKEHVYHAKLRIRQGTRFLVVDIRPSDALCLSLAFERPIFFTDEVLKLIE